MEPERSDVPLEINLGEVNQNLVIIETFELGKLMDLSS